MECSVVWKIRVGKLRQEDDCKFEASLVSENTKQELEQ